MQFKSLLVSSGLSGYVEKTKYFSKEQSLECLSIVLPVFNILKLKKKSAVWNKYLGIFIFKRITELNQND